MSIFFSSDTHFWHENILKFCPNRGSISIEEMNELLINNWNSIVSPEDEVYFLGDFSLAKRPVETITNRLNGKKHLIAGNHDWVHSCNKKSKTLENKVIWTKYYLDNGWYSVQMYLSIEIDNKIVEMCHLPYLEENTDQDQRHSKYRLKDEGNVLLCGHVHQHWQTRKTNKGTLMINVGVDANNLKPISLEEVKELIKESNR